MTQQETSGTVSRRRRWLAVVAAVAAAVAVWAVATFGLGVDVREPQRTGQARDLGAAKVVGVTAVVSLAGWALLAVLERFSARARRWWAAIAVVVAVASLVAPLTAAGVTGSSRVVLAGLHLIVGAVLIPLLYRSSPNRKEQAR
ncbi:MAG: hypothetical protein H0U09_06530 [Geodermatophilaceae bacterium]|nr:hypothetical protein [Geodermatophilaceae bacterium]